MLSVLIDHIALEGKDATFVVFRGSRALRVWLASLFRSLTDSFIASFCLDQAHLNDENLK